MPQWDVRFDLHVDLKDEFLLGAIHEAAAIADVTQRIPLKPEVRRALNRLNIIRAVRGTTGIEGSDLTELEVEQVLAAPESTNILPPSRRRQEMETRNAARAMEFVAVTLADDPARPLTEGLIAEIHRRTTDGIPYKHNVPGEYRRHGVSVGEYVPPRTFEEIRRLMPQFIEWVNSSMTLSWHPVIRAVAAHFYLVSIHPFGDGNGRTSRSVESYILYQGRLNKLGFYSLSNFYYRERDTYFEMLDFTRSRSGGSLTEFVRFAAQGFLEEMKLIRDEVLKENQTSAFYDYAKESLSADRKLRRPTANRMIAVMEFLRALGQLEVESARRANGPIATFYRTSGGARAFERDIASLQKAGLVVVDVHGVITPNLELMSAFVGPAFEFQ